MTNNEILDNKIYIVLVEPKNEENVGAIARVMKNFGFKSLILINPKCNIKGENARRVSKHAFGVLKRAEIWIETSAETQDFKKTGNFDYVIGTSSRLGSEYNFQRLPITPENLAEKIRKIKKSRIAILFGREGSGLTNKEISQCDFMITIPTSKHFPTMNISHAVAIVLYELQKRSMEKKLVKKFIPANASEKAMLLKKHESLLNTLDFATSKKKETQKMVWKRVLSKSFLTRREAFALFGFFKKIEEKIKRGDEQQN